MKTTEIRTDLLKKIDELNASQLKDVYGLVQNYFSSTVDTEEWDLLSPVQRAKINKGVAQANANLGSPLADVMLRIRSKHGLNG